jgi:uncharacterized protein YdeI (YjbR/CyaY-like superfamily)
MSTNKMNPEVEAYFNEAERWQEQSKKLRKILLSCELTEELKWGKPCYAFQEGNVVIIQGFKAYCALLFFKGVLLKDPNGILKKTGVNTRVGRQIRFTSVREIVAMEPVLKAYINAAIEVEKAGLKVTLDEEPELVFPEEFQKKLDDLPALRAAFEALTPGRQRAYNFYFSGAKQSKTREARVKKCLPHILNGEGLND